MPLRLKSKGTSLPSFYTNHKTEKQTTALSQGKGRKGSPVLAYALIREGRRERDKAIQEHSCQCINSTPCETWPNKCSVSPAVIASHPAGGSSHQERRAFSSCISFLITNYHRFTGLKQHKFIVLQFYSS
jgi:hypothetical protein